MKSPTDRRGQTASELAIFGAILIMVIGTLVSYSLLFNYSQNFQMLAFRQALKGSHEIDRIPASSSPNLFRRTASVVIIQDRNMPDLTSPFGIMERSATGSSASATYNRHLSANISYDNVFDLPTVDFFINNQHFWFTTAGYETVSCNPDVLKRKVAVGTEEFDKPTGCTYCPASDCSENGIWWKWYRRCIGCHPIFFPPYDSSNIRVDVDGDNKEEEVLETVRDAASTFCQEPINPYACPITTLQVLDYQEGEIDFSLDSNDFAQGAKTQGLLAEGSAEYKVEPGTQLEKSENPSQITTTTTVKRTDIITRIIRLNSKHTDWASVIDQAGGVQGNCRTANSKVTCFEPNDSLVGGPALFIRSNLKTDKPPQKWTIAK